MLCVGVSGHALSDAERTALQELGPGAIVLFARNVSTLEATRTLVADVRAACGGDAPALVCVDQEGGRVARLRFGAPLPSMATLGATDDESLAERTGAALAFELRRIGASVDFAPVLDLALDGGSTVIGTRSLGDDPARVASLGAALVRGLQAGGVVSVPKHFPGHGATALDSHRELPTIPTDGATLRSRELVPFAAAFAAGARAVMTAHVVVPALDPAWPATLSRAVLTGLLREELGFTGVCFTDDLQMDAIARGPGSAAAAPMALAAGADCPLVCHDLSVALAARDAIVAAVGDGDLPRARLEEAAERMASLRAAQPAAGGPAGSDDADLGRELARRGLRRVRGDLMLDRSRPVTVVSFEGGQGDGVAAAVSERPSLSLALRRRRLRSELMRVALEPDSELLETLLEVLRAQGTRNVVVLARRAHVHPAQQHAIGAILDVAPDAIVVSALEAFDVPCFGRARTVAATHGDEEPNVEALADALAGEA